MQIKQNLINTQLQLVQFKQNKTNSMIYLGARDISDIEYNEDGIRLVNQQNNSAE